MDQTINPSIKMPTEKRPRPEAARFGFSHIPRARRIPHIKGELEKAAEQVGILKAAVQTGSLNGKRLSREGLSDAEESLRTAEQMHNVLQAALQHVTISENQRSRRK